MGIERQTQQLVRDHLGQSPHDGVLLTLGGAQQRVGPLSSGTYRISAPVDLWYAVGDNTVAAAWETAPAIFLGAGAIDYVTIHKSDSTRDHVSLISTSSAKGSFSRAQPTE